MAKLPGQDSAAQQALFSTYDRYYPQMAAGKRWTRDELLVLLNVYDKLPFGQFDQAQPVIRDIAKRMGRTPGSIAMKLCNLASFDPALKARGRKGLPGASSLDREMWNEFQAHRDSLVPKSEDAFRKLFGLKETDEVDLVRRAGVVVKPVSVLSPPKGPTETVTQRKIRRGQEYFRQMVLNAFDGKCCVTGIAIRELLVASHILPWKKFPNDRLNQQNGLCLSRLHDGAFDRGFITFDEKYRLVLSKELKSHFPQKALKQNFATYEGKPLSIPIKALAPNVEFLTYHRDTLFKG